MTDEFNILKNLSDIEIKYSTYIVDVWGVLRWYRAL